MITEDRIRQIAQEVELEYGHGDHAWVDLESARDAIRKALAEDRASRPEVAPIAWRWRRENGPWAYSEGPPAGPGSGECEVQPLYAREPQVHLDTGEEPPFDGISRKDLGL